jgi:hypothetical protein
MSFDKEYINAIRKYKLFLCEGVPNLLADAYYNNIKSVVLTNKYNYHDLVISMIAQHAGHCQLLPRLESKLIKDFDFTTYINPNVKTIEYFLKEFENGKYR